ncbi:MAG: cation diffusion facilitator family transporter [Bacilli bacterium]
MESSVSKKADRGVYISIIAYVVLSVSKVAAGIWADSDALFADGLNNATDILASVAVLIGLHLSRKPRDHDHPYGHTKSEQISSLVASFIMASVGIQVIVSSIAKLGAVETESPNTLAAYVAIISSFVMFAVYFYNHNLAKRTNSMGLEAAAKDNLSDALVSLGAFVGIIGSQLGMPFLDPLTAFIVGVVILKTAYEIFRDASHLLTDGFDPDLLKEYRSTIAHLSDVREIVDLRARRQGNLIFVDATIAVDGQMSVAQSHDIADLVENKLHREHNVYFAHVHIEPVGQASQAATPKLQ